MKALILRAFSWLASLALVGSALYIAYVVLFPVNVLDDWTLTLSGKDYYLGDTLTIESSYKKNVNAKGTSTRYLECRNSNNVFVRYQLNEATGDKPASRSSTGIIVKIPAVIAEVTLPTKCYFSISVVYDLYPRRAEPEYARTEEFTLNNAKEPQDHITQQAAPGAEGPSSNIALIPTSPRPSTSTPPAAKAPAQSAPQSKPPSSSPPTPAPTPRPQPQPPQQTLLQRTIDGVFQGVTNVVSLITSLVTGRR